MFSYNPYRQVVGVGGHSKFGFEPTVVGWSWNVGAILSEGFRKPIPKKKRGFPFIDDSCSDVPFRRLWVQSLQTLNHTGSPDPYSCRVGGSYTSDGRDRTSLFWVWLSFSRSNVLGFPFPFVLVGSL